MISKKQLDSQGCLYEIVLSTPLIAQKARAGNFILLRIYEKGERFPLTIADYNREDGTITIVFQVVGKSTELLSTLNASDALLDVVGPLGNDIHIKKYENPVLIIGGGVGIAPAYPQAKELKEAGNMIISIIGARTKNLLFWKDKMEQVSDELIICTDDGSEGIHGVVTDPLKDIIAKKPISLVIAIGPLVMMKYVTLTTNGEKNLPKIKTMVSLNTIMVDGTGMCGGCRFKTNDGEFYFACVDGPDVDGHIVDFDNLMNRAERFCNQEEESLHIHRCQCENIAKSNNEMGEKYGEVEK
ncbi:MAG: sulfide/dihydroorotate dehydrogenase-like FAD/NAD-binding protein [Candidatus Lokiarchaeota archaeon]|nr:sulfide/dihydroorotate dehydrogenase-like FAD/NAD-binding protein [Candidatus Lokiarchaeota archaeon]